MSMKGSAAIVGIGQTDISSASGRSDWQLALEASVEALADAGVDPAEVDGIVRYSYDNVTEGMLVRSLGIRELSYYGEIAYGGLAAAAVVSHAAAAIAAGHASTVLVFRSLNERSGVRYGRAERHIPQLSGTVSASGLSTPSGQFAGPYGLLSPGHVYAMVTRRYQYEHGVSEGDMTRALGTVAVQQRAYANRNPRAMMYERTMTLEDYQNARIIASPLRLFDYCLESDGAAALVVTRSDIAGHLRPDPVYVLAATQSMAPHSEPAPVYRRDITELAPPAAAQRLYAMADLRPNDVGVAELYDAFSILVLLQLEAFGFAEPGKGWRYLLDHGIGPESRLPVNTHGGHLSEGYLHGLNHVTEAVRQLRGTAANPVSDGRPVLMSSHLMSSAILTMNNNH